MSRTHPSRRLFHRACSMLFATFSAASLQAATFTVTTVSDSGPGSLRQALLDANANAGNDTIAFQIGSGAKTIAPLTQLPDINQATLFDARTQPGFVGIPLIRIDGAAFSNTESGLRIYAGPTTLQGLIVTRFPGAGIYVGAGDDIVLRGCWIGTTGSAAGFGNGGGVRVGPASNVSIGGTGAGDGNVLADNSPSGIDVDASAGAVVVQGNRIGTNVAGSAALPNGSGLRVYNADTLVGGNSAPARNLISGNAGSGVYVAGPDGANVRVFGNYIGTDAAGTSAIGNVLDGVNVATGSAKIGFGSAAERNLISGNGNAGIGIGVDASAVQVLGNYLGTNAAGNAAIGNGTGIRNDGHDSQIGGTLASDGNVISGNDGDGISVGVDAAGGSIRSNRIGTNVAGTAALGNGLYGVSVRGTGMIIGAPIAGNLISGNVRSGITLADTASGHSIRGNTIGLDVTGTQALGNQEDGIDVHGADNVIGSPGAGAHNVIAANPDYAIYLAAGADGNTIQNNYIGTNPAAAAGLGNGFGIYIDGGNGNSIGGTSVGQGNVIANSPQIPLLINVGQGNRILRNSIYGNSGPGIELSPSGPRANDALDADLGPNQGQNYPWLRVAQAAAGVISVSGALDSAAAGSYRVEFFWSPVCHYSGFGAGQKFLGALDVVTNGSGHADLAIGLADNAVSGYLTATATDAAGNTSEFSPCIAIGPQAVGEFNFARETILAYEDLQAVDVYVTRSHGVTGAASVQFHTSNGSAIAPGDYTSNTTTLHFADGEVVKYVHIPLVRDDVAEGTEEFQVTLASPTGGALIGFNADNPAALFDHDPAHPSYFTDDAAVEEPGAGSVQVQVAVHISGSDHPIDIEYQTADASAEAGQDYVATSGMLTFAVGETTKLVPVTVLADAIGEGAESFYLQISGFYAQGVIAQDGEAEITISSNRIFADGFD
ncbi:MAG: right-handed parallel beta-helix repeat-containing protein [Xanthomonadales bacterium]|nr:right-handed parallel beta-helix repeat-containing protein [Xanthomonadales bacterium]